MVFSLSLFAKLEGYECKVMCFQNRFMNYEPRLCIFPGSSLPSMATSSVTRFAFLERTHQLVSPTSTSDNNARVWKVNLSYQTGQKRNGLTGRRFSMSPADREDRQKNQVQELVDHLHVCAEKGVLREAKAIHGHILKSNLEEDNLLVLLNHVAHAYSKCSAFSLARGLFNALSRKNTFSWTVMIGGSIKNGLPYDGFEYFFEMLCSGILPDAFAYPAILKLCIALDSVDLGKMVHAQIVIRGFASHVFVSTSLLTMYAKLGMVEDSCLVFDNMDEHNEVSWNAMISGFTTNGLYPEAFNYFLEMKEEGFTPDVYSLISVLKAVGMLEDVSRGKQVHEYVTELDMESNLRVGTALIDMYSKCGALSDARSVFDMHFATCGVNALWNAMISGYSQCKSSGQALELYTEMCQSNIHSDLYTFCSVFDAIADLRFSRFLREVHGKVLKLGCSVNSLSVENAIADAYSKCGSLEDVRKIFNGMKQKDIVSWTTLISAYSQCSVWDEALASFSQMRVEGFMPNEFTLSGMLVACAGLCYLEYGRQIHGLLCKIGLGTERCIEGALIDMYAKCGSITEARKVFDCIPHLDVVSWTAMISGYAQHGYASYALQLFRRMEQLGIKANSVTLLCVLFACSHGGMVEEGLDFFWSMEKNYGLVPEMEHYACVVDLLGRVGRLNEAYEFISKMPIEPDEMVWQTLLAACRIHGDVELGEIAAKKILSTQPEYSATYVLLSNTYMGKGSFKDGLHLRNIMKEQGIRKEPGYSWITLNGKVHRFYAGDQKHPQKDDIYLKLKKLQEKIKALGYVPDLRYALLGAD